MVLSCLTHFKTKQLMFPRSGQQDNISRERSNRQIGEEINYNMPSSHTVMRHKTGSKTMFVRDTKGYWRVPANAEVLEKKCLNNSRFMKIIPLWVLIWSWISRKTCRQNLMRKTICPTIISRSSLHSSLKWY